MCTSIGYLAVPHEIGRRPGYVTVQILFTRDGSTYISEAEGNIFSFLVVDTHRWLYFVGHDKPLVKIHQYISKDKGHATDSVICL
jgi:hypothetical protein